MWRIRVDTGGTFTDALGISPSGEILRRKVLSSGRLRFVPAGRELLAPGIGILGGACVHATGSSIPLGRAMRVDADRLVIEGSPDSPLPSMIDVVSECDAARLAIHLLTQTPIGEALPPIDLRVATTRGTNALLTETLDRVLLITTSGFEDLPIIGHQARDDIFALNPNPKSRRLLPAAVLGVAARLDVAGRELVPLETAGVLDQVHKLQERDAFDSIAIAFLHAWRDPGHELEMEAALRGAGLERISVSFRCSPGISFVPRMQTAITDAALARTIESFIAGLGPNHPGGSTLAMNSAGGLVSALRYAPCESLLSGPAAGVVGAVASARSVGEERIIAFDMGGTSTDVSRYAGRTDLMDETTVGRASVRVPSIDLDSVAAGGGSICAIKADRLVVGPESSGAHPGPACYGAGGPLSLTDVNLLLGRVDARNFGVPLHPEAADEALAAMLAGTNRDPHATLEGFLALANERMAQAIRTIAVSRGDDPATHTLVAFGGAGPQHACAVADSLGIQRILIPADTGILSAVGLHASGRHQRAERAILAPLCDVPLQVIVAELEAEALHRATADGVKQPHVLRRQVRCRLHKQEATIDLECDSLDDATTQSRLKTRFEAAFERRYGYRVPDRPIEVAAIRIFAGTTETHDLLPLAESKARTHAQRTRLCSRGEWIDASSIDRASLGSTDQLDGPALLVEPTATTIVDAGWVATVDPSGAIVLNRFEPLDQRTIYGEAVGEIVTCRLESIARDMGEALRRTALSINVRERLDYSCAILDSEGRLIVNAPHMPVHLGALGVCVRAVRDRVDLKEGDVALVNHPAFGGSHLPDLTVVSPAIVDDVLIGFLASRAHHAEIGGTRPGSMPPDATRLVEEGVVFEPRLIVQGGQPSLEDVARRLATSPFPSRLLEDNLADLDAQIAANHLGVERLAALYRDAGPKRFTLDLEALRDRCRRATSSIAHRWPALDQTVVETLDDGTAIQVRVRSDGERLAFDFTGTSTQHPGNLNAPHAVTTAAVLYVLRVLSEEAIPMNEGALDGVSITIPKGSFLSPTFLGDPREDPAVAIGNTETSQRIVDTLLRAFGVAACSQGTMNNTLLGTDVLAYYETVCGGAGAIEGEDGCSAVHTHMTNTRITDPEILEWRMPVRLNTFALRPDSGGGGRWRGGDGVIREIEALEALDLSVLGQHRTAGPYGLEGGEPGAPAEQFIVRKDGTREALRPIAAARLQPGDTLHLRTPGGGGFGPSP